MKRTEINLSGPFEEILATSTGAPEHGHRNRRNPLCQAPPIQGCAKAPSATQKLKKPCVLYMKRPMAGRLKHKLALWRSLHRSLASSRDSRITSRHSMNFSSKRSQEFSLEIRLAKSRTNGSWTPGGKLVTSRARNKRPPQPHKKRKRKCFPLPNSDTISSNQQLTRHD